jgi:hypothetical protein
MPILAGNNQSGRLLVEIRIHSRACPGFRQFLFKHFSDVRILVIILDLVATGFDVFIDLSDIAEAFAQTVLNPA